VRKFFICIVLISSIVVFGTWIFAEKSGPNATALWTYITNESPYTGWSFWDDQQGMQAGRGPYGTLHKIYVNDRLRNSHATPAPYGSICVKENYDGDKKLAAITVMCKVQGFNPENGDWLWVRYGPGGRPEKEGKIQECIECHRSQKHNDFIVAHDFGRHME